MRNHRLFAAAALLFAMASHCSGAEVYPNKPVHIVASFGPGTVSDFVARTVSQQMADQLNNPFVVDNKPGATGTIGYGYVAKSKPDGYTLLLVDTSFSITPSLFKSLPFNITKDFVPITQFIKAPPVLVVSPSLNVNTLPAFIELARKSPGKLNYGSGGTGGSLHLWSELFKSAAKVDLRHVPYKSGADVVTAVLGGEVQMLITGITVLPQVKAGKLRALAILSDGSRSSIMPDVPSMKEAGLPDVSAYNWHGLAAPDGVPREVVSKLHAEAVKALAAPAVVKAFAEQGAETVGNSPEEFRAYVLSEVSRWAAVAKSIGIQPE